jgi:hypothetical protein
MPPMLRPFVHLSSLELYLPMSLVMEKTCEFVFFCARRALKQVLRAAFIWKKYVHEPLFFSYEKIYVNNLLIFVSYDPRIYIYPFYILTFCSANMFPMCLSLCSMGVQWNINGSHGYLEPPICSNIRQRLDGGGAGGGAPPTICVGRAGFASGARALNVFDF